MKYIDEQDLDCTSSPERRILNFSKRKHERAKGYFSGFYLLGRANYLQPVHTVEEEVFLRHYELIFVEKGSQSHVLAQQNYHLESGDCLLIPPGVSHSTGLRPESRGRFYWLLFDPEETSFYGQKSMQHKVFQREVAALFERRTLSLSAKQQEQLKQMLQDLFQKFPPPSENAQQSSQAPPDEQSAMQDWRCCQIEHELCALLWLLISASKEAEPAQDWSQLSWPVKKICRYIQERREEKIEYEELLELSPYSAVHTQRIFRRELGLPLRDYINREKVLFAQELMCENPKWEITRISTELNFSSTQYFSTVFKRYCGLSPSDWRKKNLPQPNKASN